MDDYSVDERRKLDEDKRRELDEEYYGVENEDLGDGEIVEPYDPNQIRVRLWTPTLDLLLKRMHEGEVDLEAAFQRKAGIWKGRAQSQLIESLLLRIPIPAFYFDGSDESLFVVIDGIQRLTALKRFMLDNELQLTGLEFLKDLNNKFFADLPRPLRRRIEETMLTVYIVEQGTPDEAKLNIFKRINTGGMTLTPQEIRHAMNPGAVRQFLSTLAASEEFKSATAGGVRPDRMDDRELVARFATFSLLRPENYKNRDFDAFVNRGMKTVNQLAPEQREDLARDFLRSMKAAEKIFNDRAFRKMYERTGKRKPINKALFETWSVNLSRLNPIQLEALIKRRERVLDDFVALMNEREFEAAVTAGTGDPLRVMLRFQEIEQLIQRILV